MAVALAFALAIACRKEAAGPAPAAAASPPRVPRDVVLITIDTLRFDATGFDGNPRGTTPGLDRFASEGRVFTSAHSHNVITLPSHTNILTGMLPYQHGVRENAGFKLSAKIPTLATRLKAKGYTTGAFVGAFVLDSRYGLGHDFDVYDELYRHLDEQLEFNIQQARADDVVKAALEWYRASAGKPRFLWVHVYDPHAPYDPPAPYAEKFKDDLYLGEVAYTDAALAPLLEAVRAQEPAPLLVVTGDHGEARGDHGELTHGLFCYEATLHIPLFAWCPPLITPGRDAVPARHIDIAPTVLDAVGLPAVQELTGQSLLPASRKEPDEGNYFEALTATFNRGWAPLRGILGGGQKYIDLPIQELYDLPSDPAEAKNLAEGRPDGLRRLRKRLLELPNPSNERGTVGAEEAAKLKSLGYLTGAAETKASCRAGRRSQDAHRRRPDDAQGHGADRKTEVGRRDSHRAHGGRGAPQDEDGVPPARCRAAEQGRERGGPAGVREGLGQRCGRREHGPTPRAAARRSAARSRPSRCSCRTARATTLKP